MLLHVFLGLKNVTLYVIYVILYGLKAACG